MGTTPELRFTRAANSVTRWRTRTGGVRQPGPDRGLRDRGRRGRDRAAGRSWHANKFLSPATDGAVLPILHLNGYKIANPTVLARIPHEELEPLLRGYSCQGPRGSGLAGSDYCRLAS